MGKKVIVLLFLGLFLISLASAFNFETGGVRIIEPLESNGGIPINIQDQTSRPFDIRMFQVTNTNINISEQATIGSYDINLTSGHGLIAGDKFSIVQYDQIQQIFFGTILNVNGDIITMDTQVPYNFTIGGSNAFKSTEDMNVDGSITPQIFEVTNLDFDDAVDITRIIFHITDNQNMDDSLFGGINSLTRGVVFRKRSIRGEYTNIFNIKSNGQFGEIAFDKIYDEKAQSGLYGLTSRLTFSGQEKHGIAIRIKKGETLELVIQDDLQGLVSFTMMAEGHFSTD